MGWRHDQAAGIGPRAPSNEQTAAKPFNVPFTTSAHDGKIWISHLGRKCDGTEASSCSWTEAQPEVELDLKGITWSGFHDPLTNCVEELGGFRYARPLSEYYSVLAAAPFNAVRLSLHASGVLQNPLLNTNRCGRLARENLASPIIRYKQALHEIVDSLANQGMFVMLDIHSLAGERNAPTWCGADVCTEANEATLLAAWVTLATELCGSQNVILADIFNEPYGAKWGEWRAAVERIGNAILQVCPRWLIGVQGVGRGDGECEFFAGTACWWGENILGSLSDPVTLSIPNRVVLLPHTYGHDASKSYMKAANFPKNLPDVWDKL